MNQLNIVLLDDEMDAVMTRFDSENTGRVRYSDFLSVVAPQAQKRQVDKEVQKAADRLRSMVKQRAHAKKGSMRDPFQHFSVKKSSFNSAELFEGLKLLNIELTADKVNILFEMMDKNSDGKVTYNEFKLFIGDSHYHDVENRLRANITRLATTWTGDKDFRKVFHRLDEDGAGSLSRKKFKEGLEDLGFELTSREFERVLDRFDTDGDGEVSYKEFVSFIKNRYDSFKPVEKLKQRLRGRLNEMSSSKKEMWRAFRNLDLNGNGYIDQVEFKDGLKDLGFNLTSSEANDVMQYFDFHADGRISYEEFVAFLEGDDATSANSTRKKKDFGSSDRKGNGPLMHKLRRAFRQQWADGKDAHEIFESADIDMEGVLTPKQVFRILRDKFNMSLSQDNKDELIQKFARDDNMQFNYPDFLNRTSPAYTGHVSVGNKVDAAAAKLRTVVQKRVRETGGKNLKDPFSHFDKKDRGYFDMRAFSKGLKLLNIDLNSSDEEKLFEMIDGNNDGRVRYNEFAVFVNGTRYNNVASRLRTKIGQIARKWNGGKDLRKAFDKFDRDDNGFITSREFHRTVKDFGFDLNKFEIDTLMHQLDVDGDGRITYREFIDFVHQRVEKYNKVENLPQKVKKRIQRHARGEELWNIFQDMDRDGNGVLDKKEFRKGLDSMGLDLSSTENNDLMEYLGHETRSGKMVINYMDFNDFINSDDGSNNGGSDNSDDGSRGGGAKGVDRIILRLGKEVARRTRNGRTFDMHKPFNRADRRNKGVVDERTFKRCMEDLDDGDGNMELSSSEYKMLFKEFNDGGMINYESFLDEIIKSGKTGSSSRNSTKGHVEKIIKDIRKEIRKAWKDGVDYHDAFERFDRKGKGWISTKDFLSGLKDMNVKVSRKDESALVGKFDPSDKGEIDYHTFLTIVAPSYSDRGAQTHDDLVMEAGEKLRRLVKIRAKDMDGDLRDPFRHFDQKERGSFSARQFETGLGLLKIRLNARDVGKLFRLIDLNNDGEIRFNEFSTFIYGSKHSDAISRLRAKVTQLARNWDGGRDMHKAFKRFDRDNKKFVTGREFGKVLKSNGFEFTDVEIDMIMMRFDIDGEDRITFADFMEFIDQRVRKFSKVDKLHTKIRQKIKKAAKKTGSAKNVGAIFHAMDTDGNGSLDRNEFNEGLIDLGIELRAQELDDLIDYFDHNGNGSVSWEEFVDFVDHDYEELNDNDDDDDDSSNSSGLLKRVSKLVKREEEDNRRFSLKKELERMDRNEKEYVKDADFVDLLRSINVGKHDAKDLAREYEGSREGRVDYYKFLDDLKASSKKKSSRKSSSSSSSSRKRMDSDMKEIMRIVGKFARKNNRAMKSFKKEMQRIDRKDRGLVNKGLFKDEFNELGVDLSKSDYKQIERYFFDEDTEKVNYLDFYDEATSDQR